jgi:single-stranded DNA-binding protein
MGTTTGCRGVNHCLLEVEVLEAPQVRYTQDQTAIAEMLVSLEGLRPDDPPGQLKVVGWGNLAQELPNRVQPGQRLVIEGRLRMNTVTRQDGVKEKKAEFTLARLHPLGQAQAPVRAENTTAASRTAAAAAPRPKPAASSAGANSTEDLPSWNSAPLVPDLGDDDIPF